MRKGRIRRWNGMRECCCSNYWFLGASLLLLLAASTTILVVSVDSSDPDYQQHEHHHHLQNKRRRESSNSDEVRSSFRILSSEQIFHRLLRLTEEYPYLVTLESAQEKYGLEAAGTSSDCTFDEQYNNNGGIGCRNWILTIEDSQTHSKNAQSKTWSQLPEVFLSGALHGNERVGPTVVIETASILLEAAACESRPHFSIRPPSSEYDTEEEYEKKQRVWRMELHRANECRSILLKKGIGNAERKWLARLVTTRRIVIMPTANALGYDRNQREEGTIDPNRDFPFDIQNPQLCMQTIAGRSINELFRQHIFQIGLTFHAGTEVVAYEWGAPTYDGLLSPDDEAQKQIAMAYSNYAGSFGSTPPYRYGTMKETVYNVRGGMEDWAYAGSWDPDRVIQCQPFQFGGYNIEKTKYDPSTLRMFNTLIETSNQKTPPSTQLGIKEDLFHNNNDDDNSNTGNGHISRNIRLSLLAIDIVEPYLTILGINGIPLMDDIVPQSPRLDRSCIQSKVISIPNQQQQKETKKTRIDWTVGGGLTIDQTTILYAKWSDVPSDLVDGSTYVGQFGNNDDPRIGQIFHMSSPLDNTIGRTRWHPKGAFPTGTTTNQQASSSSLLSSNNVFANLTMNNTPIYTTFLDLTSYQPGDLLCIMATARLDQSWKYKNSDTDQIHKTDGPMSHIVNVRTNQSWYYESSNSTANNYNKKKIVQGRLDWFSIPLTLVIRDNEDEDTTTLVLNQRFDNISQFIQQQQPAQSPPPPQSPNNTSMNNKKKENDTIDWTPQKKDGFMFVIMGIFLTMILFLFGLIYQQYSLRKRHVLIKDYEEEEEDNNNNNDKEEDLREMNDEYDYDGNNDENNHHHVELSFRERSMESNRMVLV